MARLGLRARCGIVLSAAVLAFGAACTPTVPGPEVTPSSPPTETDRAKRERLEYEAAEKAYRAALAESVRIYIAGGADEPTKVLKANATGEYLEDMMGIARNIKNKGWDVTGEIKALGVVPDGYDYDGNVRMLACEDGSGIQVVDKSGEDKSGSSVYVVQELSFVGAGDGTWQVSKQDSKVVETLEGQSCME